MVTLICNEVAMFTLKTPGTYTLSRLADSCKVTNSSMSANYVKYVWNQLTTNTGSPGSNRKAYMNTVGAVTRSVNPIYRSRLDTINIMRGIPLSWKCYADSKDTISRI